MTIRPPRGLRRALFAVAVTICALALPGDRSVVHAQTPTQAAALSWTPCGARFQCATLAVPLDYGVTSSRTISLALVRQPARDPSRRIGSLLVNPGGPGASGVNFARGIAGQLAPEVQDRFDLVGFDPRGVGASSPLFCHDDIQRLAALEPEPSTPAQWETVREATARFTALCAERGKDLLPHVGSVNVVRDMERIRIALGEEKISYLGYSYGTVLGALYIDRYPDRVRAFVMDGPVQFTLSPDELTATQAAGFDRQYARYLADCRARACALADNGADPSVAISVLITTTRDRPIPSPKADRPAGAGEAMLAVTGAMYSPRIWPRLTAAVTSALDGDGSGLIRLADGYLGRQGESYDNSFAMNPAVNCIDYAYSRDVAHYEALRPGLVARAPRFGASFAPGGLTCALWPVPAQPLRLENAGRGAPPVLMIGTTNDPATPYEWALAMRLELASAVLLTHEGDGHTVYGSGNRCIEAAVNAYLITLEPPVDGALCNANDVTPRKPTTPLQARAAASTPTPAPGPADEQASAAEPNPESAGTPTTGTYVMIGLGVLAIAIAAGSLVRSSWRTYRWIKERERDDPRL